ncbi:coiled-coil domain-containing protein 87 [Pelodytes ibericus]
MYLLKDMATTGSPRKSKRPIHPMTDDRLNIKMLHQLYNDALQPLTLFPTLVQSPDERKDPSRTPSPDKNDRKEEVGESTHSDPLRTPSPEKNDSKEEVDESICRDAAYTSSFSPFMEDVSKMSPNTLCDLIRRRLNKTSGLNLGSTNVQKIFEEIILCEVKSICKRIPDVLYSTVLTAEEKQKLHRRLILHIVIVSEQLYMYYLHKMEFNKTQSVFSEEANLTRLKAQLLLDCSKFFNVFSASHYLIAEIKEMKEQIHSKNDDILEDKIIPFPKHTHRKAVSARGSSSHFTMGYFIRLGRPKVTISKPQRDVDLMQIGNIQRLDLKKVQRLIPNQKPDSQFVEHTRCKAVMTPCPHIYLEEQKSEQSSRSKHTSLKKSFSCPNLRMDALLADELCISFKSYSLECPEILSRAETVIKNEGDIVSQDLKKLVGCSSLQRSYPEDNPYCDDEIPPLIRVLTQRKQDKAKRHKMEVLLQDLYKNQEQSTGNLKTEVVLHPQTCTVDAKIPNTPLLRRADAQASDRIYTDFIEIPIYPPVYNDFSNEIDAASVSRLDRDLYVGEEINEVYKELTKNISTDHLKFDQDPIIERYATNVDFSKCVSSATLTKKRNQRVINRELDSLGSCDQYDSPQHIPVEASRTCNSWLTLWKSLVNSDDYMKYVSTQDLDYLKVIYHLYNSDSEDEAQAIIALKKKKKEQKRQRDKKIADIRAEKQNYVPGMWNINSVMLGGLGIDPDLQDLDGKETLESPSQKRINAIWNKLHVPEGQRLDMAIKYSSTEYQDLLPKAVEMWEKAVKVIKEREHILAELEMFERTASDPNRFFQKGFDGTSIARMKESKIRKKFHIQLSKIEHEILELVQFIKKTFNDTVSFKGRPYSEKIQWDKTEMLYWLQQDRRKDVLERNYKKTNALLKLEPLN